MKLVGYVTDMIFHITQTASFVIQKDRKNELITRYLSLILFSTMKIQFILLIACRIRTQNYEIFYTS